MKPSLRENLVPTVLLLVAVAAVCATADGNDRLGPFNAEPRSVRSRDYDQQHLRIRLDLDWDTKTIDGFVIHRLVPYRDLQTLEMDAAQMQVSSVTLLPAAGSGHKGAGAQAATDRPAKQELEFEHREDQLTIHLPEAAPAGKPLRLAIEYRVEDPRRGGHFVVPDEHEPDQPRMFWTQSESEYARYWFPCVDSPSDRVTSETVVTVPEDYFVLSNGTLKRKSAAKDGRRTWHWVQKKSHVPYLVSVVAGDFEAYEQEHGELPVVSYVPRGRLEQAERSFGQTPEMIEVFSDKIRYPYPWEKYTQICVDEYAWGGMEHTSATTLTLRTLHDERAELDVSSEDLVAHELAHQWFGDLLTCKDWAEIWLNESFATYFEVVWTEHDQGWDEAVWKRHQDSESYKSEDKGRYRRPIVTYRYPEPDSVFDGHAYPKGACVLHMLRFVLGDALFWTAIERYTRENAFEVVETADFRTAIERATGQGLNWFFEQWVFHGGHPEYKVRYSYDRREGLARMTVEQTQQVDELTPLFQMPIEIQIVTATETITRRIHVAKKSETFTFDVAERPERVLFDPQDWILKDLDFAKSKQELLNQVRYDKHIMVRVRGIHGLSEHNPDSDAQRALMRAAREDAFWGVRQEAAKALAEYAGDEVRAALIQMAKEDEHAKVRRAAVVALAEHPHDESKAALREIVANDPSYYTIAAALGALVDLDKENVRDDLLAALPQVSHNEVVLRAAADGLAELKAHDALPELRKVFDPPSPPSRRAAVLQALAKLGADDEQVLELLQEQLQSERLWYRMAAVRAISATGAASLIPTLLDQKKKETFPRAREAIDNAVKKLREGGTDAKLERRIEDLERRLQELEEKKGG